ncbi:MAG: hypothetical protein K0S55_603 [Clostridia bacterium]|nr:hypothetical protein [Clostridia bacterium]
MTEEICKNFVVILRKCEESEYKAHDIIKIFLRIGRINNERTD